MARISLNKLGEYLVTASPARRRRIIADQKTPPDVKVARYRLADQPLGQFFQGGGDVASIHAAVERLRMDRTGSDWAVDDRANTADALEHFLRIRDRLPMHDVEYVRPPSWPAVAEIEGVRVSIAPQFLLRFKRRGVDCVGAIKFHFPKTPTSALEQKGGEYVATLLHRWLVNSCPAGSQAVASCCFSIDVFRQSVVVAPTAVTRRMEDIEAACEEIAAHWQKL